MRRSRSLRPGTVPVLIGFIILFVVLFIAVHSLQTGSLIFWGRSEAEIPSVMALNQATSAWGMPTRRPAGAPG
jgi:hypothetical protein